MPFGAAYGFWMTTPFGVNMGLPNGGGFGKYGFA